MEIVFAFILGAIAGCTAGLFVFSLLCMSKLEGDE